MTAAAVPWRDSRALRQHWSRFTLRHPEWWVIGLAAAAAIAMLGGAGGVAHHAHGGAARLWSWGEMTAAMMLPVFVPRVRRVARTSVGRIRTRAIAQTLAGYLSVWLAFGAVVAPAGSGSSAGISVAWWLLAAGWQCTRVRYRVLNRCHAVGCPPGVRDGRRRFSAGMAYGGWCAVSCGPAMAAAVATRPPAVIMIAMSAGLLAERIARRPRTVSVRLATAMLAGAVVGTIAALA